ncbi:hypothetical protein [Agromyces binzhouensis]|uniref:hypothetical protein n=1 Tax=Agromyces binzhouensis TaxID=1817495 RepID=UPI0013ECEC87|nr:hypothetical protein [Agromyces binzhouensis]
MSTHFLASRTNRRRVAIAVVLGIVALAVALALTEWFVTGDLSAVFEGIENGLTGQQARRRL